MKTKIRRMEQVVFYDLEGFMIKHMCYWLICYESGTERKIKGYGSENLTRTQRLWYMETPLRNVRTGIYGESATTRTRVYYK